MVMCSFLNLFYAQNICYPVVIYIYIYLTSISQTRGYILLSTTKIGHLILFVVSGIHLHPLIFLLYSSCCFALFWHYKVVSIFFVRQYWVVGMSELCVLYLYWCIYLGVSSWIASIPGSLSCQPYTGLVH